MSRTQFQLGPRVVVIENDNARNFVAISSHVQSAVFQTDSRVGIRESDLDAKLVLTGSLEFLGLI